MIERYLDRLFGELAFYGVTGRDAVRLRAEARDHLLELAAENGEEEAVSRFGPAEPLAREVAGQLGTRRTRRATYLAFVALALAGLGYAGMLALVDAGGGWPDIFAGRVDVLGFGAVLGTVLFPQIAFAAGCLALLRAVRLRKEPSLAGEELGVMRRRAAAALGAGALTLVSWALWAVQFGAWVTTEWAILSLAIALAIPLGVSAVLLVRAGQPVAATSSPAGDIFDDLAPVPRMSPWALAVAFALAIGLVGFVMGWIEEGDPGSGIVRGGFEAVAILVCFAALGRRLALRR